jgi:hypothetical protein
MRKITLSMLSFVGGALAMSLLGNHTSTSAQMTVLRVSEAVPVVPPFKANRTIEGSAMAGTTFAVDGILCRNCAFKNTVFEYGGGEFVWENATVALPLSIKTTGAAENTVKFLNMFGLIGCPAKNATPVAPPQGILNAKYAPSATNIKIEHAN